MITRSRKPASSPSALRNFPPTRGAPWERLGAALFVELLDVIGHVADEAHAVARVVALKRPDRLIRARSFGIAACALRLAALKPLLADLDGDDVRRDFLLCLGDGNDGSICGIEEEGAAERGHRAQSKDSHDTQEP